MIFPEVLYILEFNKRNIERAVRDFPLPDSPTNPTILFLGILLIILGFQFFSLGLLGELIYRNRSKESNKNIINKKVR